MLYSPDKPVTEPVCVVLPHNGLRLRFDGPEQRLRLIEVTDFTKNHITFKERGLLRPPPNGTSAPASPVPGDSSLGPTFRHIYHRLLGPTYAGEFIRPPGGQGDGVYVLSYPGVAFNFALAEASYSPDKDVVSLLSASSGQAATSMAVFHGDSWAEARPSLWTQPLPSFRLASAAGRAKDAYPDPVSLVRLYGGERRVKAQHADRLVATKLVLHGNIPGCYEFNRHRRCRWEIDHPDEPVGSETPFGQIEARLSEASTGRAAQQPRQRGMVLNRGWGDSPGSSCEFLGGGEESGAPRAEAGGDGGTRRRRCSAFRG